MVAGLLESVPSKGHPHVSTMLTPPEVGALVGSTLWQRKSEKGEASHNHVEGFAWGQLALGGRVFGHLCHLPVATASSHLL